MEPHNNLSGNNNQQLNAPRKNSDLLRDAHATFSVLPQKEAEDLRAFLSRNSENIRTYDLTEENLKWLKHLRKYPSLYSACSTPVAGWPRRTGG